MILEQLNTAAEAIEATKNQGLEGDDLHAVYNEAFNAFASLVCEFAKSLCPESFDVHMVRTHGWDSHYITVENTETEESFEIRVANHPNNHGESTVEFRYDLPKYWSENIEEIKEAIEEIA